SGDLMRFSMICVVMSSGTSFPSAIMPSTSRPSSVPSLTSCLKMSPGAMCKRPNLSATSFAWVPLPAPGGPKNKSFTVTASLQKAFIIAHYQLSLNLLHGLKRYTHHNQQRSTAQGSKSRQACYPHNQVWQDGNSCKEQRSHKGNLVDYFGQRFSGRLARTNTRYETAELPHVVSYVIRIEHHGCIEIGESEYEQG